jgi:hypothetical protein
MEGGQDEKDAAEEIAKQFNLEAKKLINWRHDLQNKRVKNDLAQHVYEASISHLKEFDSAHQRIVADTLLRLSKQVFDDQPIV